MGLAKFLADHPKYKALAFIDPCGMELDWSAIEQLKSLPVDLWLLIPTGMGANRLLTKDGKIPEAWLMRLEKFLGVSKEVVISMFYKSYGYTELFSDQPETRFVKENKTIEKIHQLYKERLLTVFKNVSDPFVIRNSKKSIMFHFLMATNNPIGLGIANSVISNYKI
jgi:three-Cys-motif partner protein